MTALLFSRWFGGKQGMDTKFAYLVFGIEYMREDYIENLHNISLSTRGGTKNNELFVKTKRMEAESSPREVDLGIFSSRKESLARASAC